MKLKLNREQKIGLFAILTLFSIYVVINYLRGKDLFGSNNTYYTFYHNVEGLNTTGPVYIRGLKVGTVESVKYVAGRDLFLVKLKVNSQYSIPGNSVAEIYSADLLGTKALRINIGDETRYLNDRDTLTSVTEVALTDLLKNELLPLSDKISQLVTTLNTTFDNVNQVLDIEAQEKISITLDQLASMVKDARLLVSDVQKSSPEITNIISNLSSVSDDLNAGTKRINHTLDNIGTITDSLKTADIAGTINSLKELLGQIKDPGGSVGKLLYTDSLHTSIEQLLRDLDQLVKNITENPKKYIRVSVF